MYNGLVLGLVSNILGFNNCVFLLGEVNTFVLKGHFRQKSVKRKLFWLALK